jgi:hypothetical protein
VGSTAQVLDGKSCWTRQGLMEVHCQDAETAKVRDDDGIVRSKAPPGTPLMSDIDGNPRSSRGGRLFHMPSRYIYGRLTTPGWPRVT